MFFRAIWFFGNTLALIGRLHRLLVCILLHIPYIPLIRHIPPSHKSHKSHKYHKYHKYPILKLRNYGAYSIQYIPAIFVVCIFFIISNLLYLFHERFNLHSSIKRRYGGNVLSLYKQSIKKRTTAGSISFFQNL